MNDIEIQVAPVSVLFSVCTVAVVRRPVPPGMLSG